nr:MAG TPA: HK97 Family Phage Portal Protein [Caudoviricetes sp.]
MIGYRKIQLIVEKALRLTANTGDKVINYGGDNLYPQTISNLIYASKTAYSAVEKISENIICEGFEDPEFANKTNGHGCNMNDVLDATANDVARFRGWAWIVQYGATPEGYKPVDIYHVPFEYVRAELNDNYLKDPKVKNWVVFNNWDRESIKATQSRANSRIYPTYNPDTFLAEAEEYGGVSEHPGQLLYVNLSTTKPYPLSTFHAVQNEMDAENKNGRYVSRVLGRGFHMCSIVSHGNFESDAEQDEFRRTLEEMMGSDNAGSILAIRDENFATDKPFIKVDQIGTTIDKDLYKSYVEPLRRDIAIAAYNLPLPLLDSASLSYSNASGEVIRELQRVYRNSLLKIRKRISRELFQLFDLEPSKTEIKDELSNSNSTGIL